MRNRYTYYFTRKSIATITVIASNDEEAQQRAIEDLEEENEYFHESDIEVEYLDIKNVEPDGPDRSDEDI